MTNMGKIIRTSPSSDIKIKPMGLLITTTRKKVHQYSVDKQKKLLHRQFSERVNTTQQTKV